MCIKNLIVIFFSFITVIGFAQKPTAQPFFLGQTEEFVSNTLAETRILNIYLPADYKPNDNNKYPVVYLLDGSADEDFIHVTGLYHFNSFQWVNRTPRSIIVGIANVNRKRDFTFPSDVQVDMYRCTSCGQSEKFINFIEKELQPYIEKKYRTTDSKTIIGQTLGGLLATEILMKKPKLFNQYIIVSPDLWWDNASILQLKPNITESVLVYIGVGKEGLAPTPAPHIIEVEANLLADKLEREGGNNVKSFFDYLPYENRNSVGHQAVINALKFFSQQQR